MNAETLVRAPMPRNMSEASVLIRHLQEALALHMEASDPVSYDQDAMSIERIRRALFATGLRLRGSAVLIFALWEQRGHGLGKYDLADRMREFGVFRSSKQGTDESGMIQVLVCRARDALQKAGFERDSIETVWGYGYYLKSDVVSWVSQLLEESST